MTQFELQILTGREELLAAADAWNDLWERSYARQPTVRAEGIATWLEHFADGREFTAVCLSDGDRLVAALPLVRDRLRGMVPVYRLPVNCWANAGDYLVARDVEIGPTVVALVEALQELPFAVLSFEEITLGAPQWKEFQHAVLNSGGRSHLAEQSPVGVIDILGRWDDYEKSWSGNHRGAVKRSLRKLEKLGELRLERHQANDDELERLLRVAFEIENRSWKGAEGTSVLQTPGMLQYMLGEARAAAGSGHADVWFLYFDDTPIAFEYCHFAKGTCFSHKIGYDPEFSKYGPGRLLRYLQLQEYHADEDCRLFDMLGTLCNSKAKWATRSYETGHLIASVRGGVANALVAGYGWLHKLRCTTAAEAPKLGACAYLDAVDAAIDVPSMG